MKIAKEVIKKYSRWSEDLNEEVIPVSTLEAMMNEFEEKPFEEKLSDLQEAMSKLGDMFNEVGKKLND
jgi:hypothetical protein